MLWRERTTTAQKSAKILGIRYQHVRNVLLQWGFTGGLRREAEAEREPVEVDAAPAPREDTSWTVLTDAGFQFIGEWTQHPESLIRLDAKAPTEPAFTHSLSMTSWFMLA